MITSKSSARKVLNEFRTNQTNLNEFYEIVKYTKDYVYYYNDIVDVGVENQISQHYDGPVIYIQTPTKKWYIYVEKTVKEWYENAFHDFSYQGKIMGAIHWLDHTTKQFSDTKFAREYIQNKLGVEYASWSYILDYLPRDDINNMSQPENIVKVFEKAGIRTSVPLYSCHD